jgi:hypothetical protein
MILVCQSILFGLWLWSSLSNVARDVRQSNEQDRFFGLVTTVIGSALVMYCYVTTGALRGFLFF